MRSPALIAALTTAVLIAGCGSDDPADGGPPSSATPELATPGETAPGGSSATRADAGSAQMFPDVIDATAVRDGDTWTIAATLSSPYDSPDRYADAWRVVGPDGSVYGERILTHDHANEQPFTRSQSGIEIPPDVTDVVIEGRDQEFGYGGATFALMLPT